MKKILLFLGLSFAVCSQAQQTMVPANANKMKTAKHMQFNKQKLISNKGTSNASRAVSQSYWLNYGISQDAFLGAGSAGPATLNANYLFPDSLGYGEFGTGNFAPAWIHHLGDILDVSSQVFNDVDQLNWGRTTAYSLDSMSIIYGYTRKDPNTAVVDTLIVTVFNNASPNAANNPGYYFPGETANYGVDTVSFRAINYNPATNKVIATGSYTFKVPLTIVDTAAFSYSEKKFKLPVPFAVPAGKLLTADVQFKPGYTYALGDHIDYDHNAFFFTSYEENGNNGGLGTFPSYTACPKLSTTCDYNSSHIVPQDVRYNMAGTWNGTFIPAYAYTAPYAFEHHLISYYVTAPPTVPLGINEVTGSDFSLGQNIPNPFTNQTKINYQIKKDAKNVAFVIYDVAGVKVFEKTQSNVATGTYSVEVNDVNFSSGMYFYSLTVDGNKLTKKMVVTK